MNAAADTTTDVRYSWKPVRVDEADFVLSDAKTLAPGSQMIAGLPRAAAIYRWAFFRSQRLEGACIGETESLQRRIRGYLSPGPTQDTNKRMNSEFRAAIVRGEEIRLETVEIVPVQLNRVHICNGNLGDQYIRKMMESFLLADFDVINSKLYNLVLNPIERRKRRAGKDNPYKRMLTSMGIQVN